MSRTVTRWGDYLAVRIPATFAEQLQWDENTEVICAVVDGNLVISLAGAPGYDLDQLVAGITPENRHEETPTGLVVGNEAW
jgi:antitoxin MazE